MPEVDSFLKDDGSVLKPGDLVLVRAYPNSLWRIQRLETYFGGGADADVVCWLEEGEISDPHLHALYRKNGHLRTGPGWVRKLSPLELLARESP